MHNQGQDRNLLPPVLDYSAVLNSQYPAVARRVTTTRTSHGPARRWFSLALLAGLILAGVAGANLFALRWRAAAPYLLDVGAWGDQQVLDGFYAPESDDAGATYRWTTDRSTFQVGGFARGPAAVLTLDVGGLPPSTQAPRPVAIALDRAPVNVPILAPSRQYRLLLPAGALADGNLDVVMTGEAAPAPPDRRQLGMRLDAISLGWAGSGWAYPAWQTLLVQCGLVLVWLAIGRRLELPSWSLVLIVALALPLLAGMTASLHLIAQAWQTRLLLGSLVLLGLAWSAEAWIARAFPAQLARGELRWLGLITVAAVAVRLGAIFFPAFESHDLYLHRKRLLDVQLGTLQLFDTPSEFASSRTIVPPAYYLLVSPLSLLTAGPAPGLQGLYAFVDGAAAFILAIFVRLLGGSARAARLAAILLAVLPIQFTALWWGFGPQVVSQALVLLLALLLAKAARPTRDTWLAAGALLLLVLLMHPGTAVLTGAWLGAYILLLWLLDSGARANALRWALLLVAASGLAVIMLYLDVVSLQLSGAARGATTPNRFTEADRIELIFRGLRSSLRPIGLPLSMLSLFMLVRHTGRHRRWLVAAWLLSAGSFFVVDLALGLQVRYAYFAVPLICAGLGLLLDRLMRRRWGLLLGWSAVGYTMAVGLQLWFAGVFAGVRPSLMALLH